MSRWQLCMDYYTRTLTEHGCSISFNSYTKGLTFQISLEIWKKHQSLDWRSPGLGWRLRWPYISKTSKVSLIPFLLLQDKMYVHLCNSSYSGLSFVRADPPQLKLSLKISISKRNWHQQLWIPWPLFPEKQRMRCYVLYLLMHGQLPTCIRAKSLLHFWVYLVRAC